MSGSPTVPSEIIFPLESLSHEPRAFCPQFRGDHSWRLVLEPSADGGHGGEPVRTY